MSNTHKARFVLVSLLAALILVIAGCGGSAPAPAAKALVEVKFMQAFSPSSEYAHFLVAQEKGYYKDEGIDFKQQEGTGSANAIKVVGSGDSPIGLADAGQVLVGRTKGVPIKSVMAVYNMTPVNLLTLEGSGIKSLKDLVGRSLGDSPTTSNLIIWKAAMTKAGLDFNKVNFIGMDGSAKVAALLQGKVDTILGQQQGPDIEAQGKKAVTIPLSASGLDIISDTIIVNEAFLKKNPELVRGFLRATIKGFTYAHEHPQEAIDFTAKYYPTIPKDVLLKKIAVEFPWIWTPSVAKDGLGVMRAEQWQTLQKLLLEGKQLDKEVDLSQAYTNEFLTKK